MSRTHAIGSGQAVALGQRRANLYLVHHVVDGREFVDGLHFYRFCADEPAAGTAQADRADAAGQGSRARR